jgi:hypothetical protein
MSALTSVTFTNKWWCATFINVLYNGMVDTYQCFALMSTNYTFSVYGTLTKNELHGAEHNSEIPSCLDTP